jgi:hypothetical protein
MSQRMVYASQGSYQTLVYDPCTRCGGSGSIKDRNPNQNTEPMGFIDSLSGIITLAISIFICWNISETAIYSELTMNGKFTLMVVSFIISFFGASVICTLPIIQKLMSWTVGLSLFFIGLVILVSLI